MIDLKNKIFKRKFSVKIPAWVLSIFLFFGLLILYNTDVKNIIPSKITYISALLAMPDVAFSKISQIKDDAIEFLTSKNEISQKFGTLNDNENINDLTVTPADIIENTENFSTLNYNMNGKIDEKTFTDENATDKFENVFVRNVTDSKNIDIQSILCDDFSLPIKDFTAPTVLIYHTHSTETYIFEDNGLFSTDFPTRNDNTSVNMIRIGDEITEILENHGIGVIHDKTIYDSVYTGAYEKSREGITKILEENPSVIITLDIHRDALYSGEFTRIKPSVSIKGKKAAQMMIIAGCEDGNVTDFPNWQTNLSFAVHLQKTVNDKYENLMKPIFFCMRKYNMDITPYSLLIEIGTDVNTLQEAAYSGRLLGDALADFIKVYAKDISK